MGSVASGSFGLPRQTNDVGIVADIDIAILPDLWRELQVSFYADAGEMQKAIEQERFFNLIHLISIFKFDVFPVGSSSFSRSELSRRRYTCAAVPGLENIEFPVASAEDTILSKLVWLGKGGYASDRQWQDILGILRVQAGRLDLSYLGKWAAELSVSEPLAKALSS